MGWKLTGCDYLIIIWFDNIPNTLTKMKKEYTYQQLDDTYGGIIYIASSSTMKFDMYGDYTSSCLELNKHLILLLCDEQGNELNRVRLIDYNLK